VYNFVGFLMVIIGYLMGSIPVGYLVARVRGVDLLASGSGRTGGTNVLRAAGLPAALVTVLGDAFKGLIPTYVAAHLFPNAPWIAALTGAAAIVGHNYSIFLKFRGGAGAVTALGALAALNFPVALIGSMVAIGAIVITRYASVGSFLGNLTGLLMLIVFAGLGITPWDYILYGILAVAIIGIEPVARPYETPPSATNRAMQAITRAGEGRRAAIRFTAGRLP
jgi:glycerol-3-phosphate acyltransferase PlsY